MAKDKTQLVEQIATKKLHKASFHQRSNWGNMADLIASIKVDGIIVPISVRPAKNGMHEINAGVRRWTGATKLGLETVPCIVQEMDDVDAIVRQVTENRDREPLHAMDEALYFDEMTRMGLELKDVAQRFRMKVKDVARKLQLVALGPPARKAFIANVFDEESALALARMSDAAKQKDVISALDAGHLQPEEIVGYVQRMFTASLDDVPWRMTDAALFAQAGACSKCPKRSDVQKDMFIEGGATGSRCLDVDCYRTKMDTSYQRVRAVDGTVVSELPIESIFILAGGGSRPTVMRSSGMVDAEGRCALLDGLSWREAIVRTLKPDAERPTEYLARDQDGRPRFLLREAIVSKMVKKSDAAREAREAKLARETALPEEQATAAKNDGKIRRAIVAELAKRVTSSDQETWGWVAQRVVANATARSQGLACGLLEDAIRGLPVPDGRGPFIGAEALVELAAQSNRQARRVATAVLVFEEADTVNEIGDTLKSLAGDCEIDLEDLEREIRKS